MNVRFQCSLLLFVGSVPWPTCCAEAALQALAAVAACSHIVYISWGGSGENEMWGVGDTPQWRHVSTCIYIKTWQAELILGKINKYLHFLSFLEMAKVVETLSHRKKIYILCIQWYYSWWPGDTKSQGISSQDIDPFHPEYSGFSTRGVKHVKVCILIIIYCEFRMLLKNYFRAYGWLMIYILQKH